MHPFSCVFLKSYVLEIYIKATVLQSALMTKARRVVQTQRCLSAANVNPEKVYTCNEDSFGLSTNQFVNIILLGSSFSRSCYLTDRCYKRELKRNETVTANHAMVTLTCDSSHVHPRSSQRVWFPFSG